MNDGGLVRLLVEIVERVEQARDPLAQDADVHDADGTKGAMHHQWTQGARCNVVRNGLRYVYHLLIFRIVRVVIAL